MISFELESQDHKTQARAGLIKSPRFYCPTPQFMPVATIGSIRGQNFDCVEKPGYPVLLANTFHLSLRPGLDVLEKLGGIHSFMKWDNGVLTDSGGFQAFSLSETSKVTEEGVLFRNYIDNQKVLFSPEYSIRAQKIIGSDIMMAMDQCVPSTSDEKILEDALDLTYRWAIRSLAARGDSTQSLFGIIQGGCSERLRKRSAEQITSLPFDGFAIGGLAVGESRTERQIYSELTAGLMPKDKPRYMMGVGTPGDLLDAIKAGVDIFDCILPAAHAQQGVSYTSIGRVDLRRNVYKFMDRPLDPQCQCSTCNRYSRAYLHHLIRSKESLGWQLVATHNLYFYKKLMELARESIQSQRYLSFYSEWIEKVDARDLENPPVQPKRKKSKKSVYQIVETRDGDQTILHGPSGEVMHAWSGPVAESRIIYVEPVRFRERYFSNLGSTTTVWDVGLGMASNAFALIHHFNETPGPKSKLKIISFENDLSSVRLVSNNFEKFPYVDSRILSRFLEEHRFQSQDGMITWELLQGDFTKRFLKAEVPQVVFFDLFSPRTNPEAWTNDLMSGMVRAFGNNAVECHTYTQSTEIRIRMLKSGFWVAEGPAAPPKEETTVFMTDAMAKIYPKEKLLGDKFLKRIKAGPFFGEFESVCSLDQFSNKNF